jgi:hypothetical protein
LYNPKSKTGVIAEQTLGFAIGVRFAKNKEKFKII